MLRRQMLDAKVIFTVRFRQSFSRTLGGALGTILMGIFANSRSVLCSYVKENNPDVWRRGQIA